MAGGNYGVCVRTTSENITAVRLVTFENVYLKNSTNIEFLAPGVLTFKKIVKYISLSVHTAFGCTRSRLDRGAPTE